MKNLILFALLLTIASCNVTKNAAGKVESYLRTHGTVVTVAGETVITLNELLPANVIEKIKLVCPEAKFTIDLTENKLIIRSRCKSKEELYAQLNGIIGEYLKAKK
jgi:hypothetical protein